MVPNILRAHTIIGLFIYSADLGLFSLNHWMSLHFSTSSKGSPISDICRVWIFPSKERNFHLWQSQLSRHAHFTTIKIGLYNHNDSRVKHFSRKNNTALDQLGRRKSTSGTHHVQIHTIKRSGKNGSIEIAYQERISVQGVSGFLFPFNFQENMKDDRFGLASQLPIVGQRDLRKHTS